MIKIVLPLLLLATPACVGAQSTGTRGDVTASQVMLAEHGQWIADHQRWRAQHLDMARRLEAAAALLKSEDTNFARDARELKAHGDALLASQSRQRTAELVAHHVRVASEHARAAQAHHELLDEMTRLEALLKDDQVSQSAENPQ